MKKILSVSLILTLILSALCIFPISAEELPEGTLSGDYWYKVLDDGTAEITDYIGNDEVIYIPSEIEGYTVTSIGYDAFLSATATEVILPDTVTSLQGFAFRIMRNLEKIVIPESVTKIGLGAFEYCMSLNEITLPKNLESLGREALDHTPFYDNPENWENGMLYSGTYLVAADKTLSGVCKVKEGTTLIADEVFKEAKEITGFVLPDSLKSIGEASFASCRGVKTITLPENLVSIGNNAFFDCKNLENLTLPQNLEKIGCYILYDTALYDNPDNWQDGVLYLNNALLNANDDIKGEYKIKDGTYIVASEAFSGIDSLTSLIMPDSVRYIGDTAFGWCNNLEYIRFSESLTEIPEAAFFICTSLAKITIPESIVKIGKEAFALCSSLTDIVIPETVTEIGIDALGWENGINLYGDVDFTIYGKKGSAAEEFATKNNITFEEISEKYKDKVLSLLNISDPNFYMEEYEHFSTADEATPDYVLICAYSSWNAQSSATEYFGDYILHSTHLLLPDEGFGYYIYLPQTNEVYTIIEAFEKGMDVYSLFTENIIGELVGDANNDNRLSIQDATVIQKHIAGLDDIENYFPKNSFTYLFADFNRDGKINVRDATAVQKHLAGFETEKVEHTVLDVYKVENPTFTEVKIVARSKAHLTEALRLISLDATLDEMFTDRYFKENSVIVIADTIGGSCCSQLIDNVTVKGDELTVSRFRNYHEVCDDEANYQCVLIEVKKNSIGFVSDIEVVNLYALVCY